MGGYVTTALLACGALGALGLAALEVFYRTRDRRGIRPLLHRRTPWQELEAGPGERRWRCVVPFVNENAQSESTLRDLSATVALVTRRPRAEPAVRATVRVRAADPFGRADGYWGSFVFWPRWEMPLEVEVQVVGPAHGLAELVAASVRIEYTEYGREGLRPGWAEIILPMGRPRPVREPHAVDGALIIPITTRLLTDQDDLPAVVEEYCRPIARPGDVVVVAESAAAICQGRFLRPEAVRPGFWARRLCYLFPGRGSLGTPTAMQVLLQESGLWRVLLALVVGGVAKCFGRRGVFYRLAGAEARLLDDVAGTLPPYDKHIVLGPRGARRLVQAIEARTGLRAAIVDANDLHAVDVLAASPGVDVARLRRWLWHNPQGNEDEQVPILLIRPAAEAPGLQAAPAQPEVGHGGA